MDRHPKGNIHKAIGKNGYVVGGQGPGNKPDQGAYKPALEDGSEQGMIMAAIEIGTHGPQKNKFISKMGMSARGLLTSH